MDLKQYFTDTEGVGVLSTADADGKVNSAIYSRPHLLDDGYVSFIMRDRLTRSNLQQNPSAHFLFMEKERGFSGVRIYLEKFKEIEDKELIAQLSRRTGHTKMDENSAIFLVSFKVIKMLELLGDKELAME